MNDLVEVRGTSIAFEMRNGARVEYANGDREARMRSLGCPENILKRLREHRSAKRGTGPAAPARQLTERELAEINGCTVEQYQAREHVRRVERAAEQAREITRSSDADRRARAAHLGRIIAADAEQMRKDEALLSRMQDAAGIVAGKRRTL